MNRYRKTMAIFAGLVMLLSLSIVASAQWRNNRRGNDDYYGRNNYNIQNAIKSLRNNSRRFEDVLDRELDRSRYDGTRREDRLNNLAKDFKNAAEDLDDEYEGYRSQRSSSDEARRVLQLGSQLDRALSRSRIVNNNYSLQNSWSNIERDLMTVSRFYNYSYNGTYGRNRGNNDRRGRNRGRNRGNDRYNQNLRSTIVRLKNNAQRLENRLDRYEDDDDNYGRGRRRNRVNYGNLENLTDRFADAAKDLEDEYDNRRDYRRSSDEARRVLQIGQQLDREINRRGVNRQIRRDWKRIEQDLRVLADAYNYGYNNRNNRRNRNGRWGGIFDNFPF